MFELPKLPYSSLAPLISDQTLEFHYKKHHQGYVDKLNSLIAGTALEGKSLEDIIDQTSEVENAVFNNACQVWNHTFYWYGMTTEPTTPGDELTQAIQKDFGSMQALRDAFLKSGLNLFGSGWTWLTREVDNGLAVYSTRNGNNPMCKGAKPLLVCDVWEHAYYLDYQNDRKKYLDNFWQLINWAMVKNHYST